MATPNPIGTTEMGGTKINSKENGEESEPGGNGFTNYCPWGGGASSLRPLTNSRIWDRNGGDSEKGFRRPVDSNRKGKLVPEALSLPADGSAYEISVIRKRRHESYSCRCPWGGIIFHRRFIYCARHRQKCENCGGEKANGTTKPARHSFRIALVFSPLGTFLRKIF